MHMLHNAVIFQNDKHDHRYYVKEKIIKSKIQLMNKIFENDYEKMVWQENEEHLIELFTR